MFPLPGTEDQVRITSMQKEAWGKEIELGDEPHYSSLSVSICP